MKKSILRIFAIVMVAGALFSATKVFASANDCCFEGSPCCKEKSACCESK